MPRCEIDLPQSVKLALDREANARGRDTSALIVSILSEHLDLKVHTVFQVSTSGALVAGVSEEEVSVGTLLEHGDFGLGTFAGLDGEMVVLDGRAYQVHSSGEVTEAGPDAGAPFAVVTDFTPDRTGKVGPISSVEDLELQCDGFRASDNTFFALRLSGSFARIKARSVSRTEPGVSVIEAAKTQSEFVFTDVVGTLVGIWSPSYSRQFSVEGYHFHFISDDRRSGGHLLEIDADRLDLDVEELTEFRLILPETESFLKADLSKDSAAEFEAAERSH